MNIISGVKQGWVKYEDDKGNYKKRYAVLQDNVLLFYASEKDILSKNDIVLSKITTVVISSNKKGYCFTINTKDKTNSVRVESQEQLNEWVNAINSVSKIHILREKFKDRDICLSDHYKHNLITTCKKTIQLISRVIGIIKAIILASKGKLKSSKTSEHIDPDKVQSSCNRLTLSLISFVQATLKCVDSVYNKQLRDSHILSIETLRDRSKEISFYGEGTQNESALFSTLNQLFKELDFVQQLSIPSPKTDVLHAASMISDLLDEIQTLVKENEIEKAAITLNEYAKELLNITKKVFLLIPDATYAKPLTDLGAIVPKVAKDTGDLYKKAYHYQIAKPHALNASKTLHLILNQIRAIIKAAFPYEEIESLYPPSGPEDTQFKLFTEEEINKMIMEQSTKVAEEVGDLSPEDDGKQMNLGEEEKENIISNNNHNNNNNNQPINTDNQATTISEPLEVVNQENILFELDNLLEDVNNRRSSLQLNPISTQISPAPGSTPLPYRKSPRNKSMILSNFTITTPPKTNETILSSSPNIVQNNTCSYLSSSPYKSSIDDHQSDTSDKNVVDELDALLQLQTNKTNF